MDMYPWLAIFDTPLVDLKLYYKDLGRYVGRF